MPPTIIAKPTSYMRPAITNEQHTMPTSRKVTGSTRPITWEKRPSIIADEYGHSIEKRYLGEESLG